MYIQPPSRGRKATPGTAATTTEAAQSDAPMATDAAQVQAAQQNPRPPTRRHRKRKEQNPTPGKSPTQSSTKANSTLEATQLNMHVDRYKYVGVYFSNTGSMDIQLATLL